MPHLQLVAVTHPLGGIDPKLARAKADGVVDRVIAALTRVAAQNIGQPSEHHGPPPAPSYTRGRRPIRLSARERRGAFVDSYTATLRAARRAW